MPAVWVFMLVVGVRKSRRKNYGIASMHEKQSRILSIFNATVDEQNRVDRLSRHRYARGLGTMK
ncbi:hypothetical protein EDC23_1160 [Thiohalophilus thiocyanatoxydans]|uniref:Uncharacterized protein n=1 Tax=Thiohalophilus thiocyanatoxydans TaxID=381308 RepID=A0A4R8IY75_9GAMM|nr:hypothetical protein EDC23_1160 [Thiohalophilus thiocyanatoxydans]